MGYFSASNQVSGPTVQAGFAGLPASSQIMRVKLSVVTSFQSQNPATSNEWAPPNTLIGVSWRPAGTGPELVTQANLGDGTWYAAGWGQLLTCDTFVWSQTAGGVPNLFDQTYSQVLEAAYPAFQSASYSLGVSINWMGGGFWPNNQSFLTWQLEAYYS